MTIIITSSIASVCGNAIFEQCHTINIDKADMFVSYEVKMSLYVSFPRIASIARQAVCDNAIFEDWHTSGFGLGMEIPASPSAPPSFVALDTLPKLSSSSWILSSPSSPSSPSSSSTPISFLPQTTSKILLFHHQFPPISSLWYYPLIWMALYYS